MEQNAEDFVYLLVEALRGHMVLFFMDTTSLTFSHNVNVIHKLKLVTQD